MSCATIFLGIVSNPHFIDLYIFVCCFCPFSFCVYVIIFCIPAIYDHMDLISNELPTELAELLMKGYNPAKERIELTKLLGFSEVNKTSRLINHIVQAEPDLKRNFARLLPKKGSPSVKGDVFRLLFQKIGMNTRLHVCQLSKFQYLFFSKSTSSQYMRDVHGWPANCRGSCFCA